MTNIPKDFDAVMAEFAEIESISGSDIIDMLNRTLPDERIGAPAIITMLANTLPATAPIDFKDAGHRIPVEYLPRYAGLPELSYVGKSHAKFDIFCAEEDGVWLNTSESRVVTVRCGFIIGLSGPYEAQIRPLPELTSRGIVAQFGSIDSDNHSEVAVTLVNLTNTRQKIERGQRIARMLIVSTGITDRSDLVSVYGLG